MTEAPPTVTENGAWKSSPVPADLVQDEGMEPFLRRRRDEVLGAAGGSVEPPHAGAGVGIRAATDRVDDVRAPNSTSSKTWQWFSERPMIKVSMSV